MLQVSRADVVHAPFPHIVKDAIIPHELFARLKADYPTEATFSEEQDESGAKGSRVGKGTGFDIYRGDKSYDHLVETSPAWAEFDAYINSAAFVRTFMDTFGDDLAALGCSVTVDPDAYDRSEVEGREVLKEGGSIVESLHKFSRKLFGKSGERTPLFTRLDVEKSVGGYAKRPHCDRANRLCSLIVYFTDMEGEGIVGGDLQIYAHRVSKRPAEHERHPDPSDVNVVATITPRENLGVFFPCSNNSYHGVTAVETQGKARDFLYINISSQSASCW